MNSRISRRSDRGEISYCDKRKERQNFEDSRSMNAKGQGDPGEDHASRYISIFCSAYRLELSHYCFSLFSFITNFLRTRTHLYIPRNIISNEFKL